MGLAEKRIIKLEDRSPKIFQSEKRTIYFKNKILEYKNIQSLENFAVGIIDFQKEKTESEIETIFKDIKNNHVQN